MDDRRRLERDGDPTETSATTPRRQSDVRKVYGSPPPSPRIVPVPAFPSLFVQLPSSHSLPLRLPPVQPSVDRRCTPARAPPVANGGYDHVSCDQVRELRKQRGYAGGDSKAALKTRLASVDEVERKRNLSEGGDMKSSARVAGKQDRTLTGAEKDSDVVLGNQDSRFRAGGLRKAFVAERKVATRHAQWRNPDWKARRNVLCASAAEGAGSALSGRIADGCKCVFGQEFSAEEEKLHGDFSARVKFEAFQPLKGRAPSKPILDTRWVLTRTMAEGRKDVKARQVATSYQDPGLKGRCVDASWCVSLRSPHLLVILFGALNKWNIWSLYIGNAFLRADSFGREVFLHAPAEWGREITHSIWRLRAPAYGLNDAPAAFHGAPGRHLVESAKSLACVGLKFQVSSFDPRLNFIFRKSGGTVGAVAARIGDISGRSRPDLLSGVRGFLEHRFGGLKGQEKSFAHVGMGVSQANDFSAQLTQREGYERFETHSHSPGVWVCAPTPVVV